jgi:hypothetical protein
LVAVQESKALTDRIEQVESAINEHRKVTFKLIPTRVIVREESPPDSALIREPLADRNQLL